MAVLQSTNVQGTLCVNGVAIGGGGKDFKYACFTASDTWTPSSDLTTGDAMVEAIVVGAGGGGGASAGCNNQGQCFSVTGGGGGGGEIVWRDTVIDSTDACSITIGAGGISGSATISSRTSANAVDSTQGGNTEAVGYTAYGGGGGSTLACAFTFAAGRRLCCTNIAGGPRGGAQTSAAGSYHPAVQYACAVGYGMSNSPLNYFAPQGILQLFGGPSNEYCRAGNAIVNSCMSSSWANIPGAASGSDDIMWMGANRFEISKGIALDKSTPPNIGRGGNAATNGPTGFSGNNSNNMNIFDPNKTPTYGEGGLGGTTFSTPYLSRGLGENCAASGNGGDGLVVLRWYE